MTAAPPRSKPPPRRQAGYTLTEMLVVLVIIVMLTALVGFPVIRRLQTARSDTAQAQIRNFAQALEVYQIDVGAYPTSDQGLDALLRAPPDAPGWAGPYLTRESLPADPWGRPYLYSYDAAADRFRIACLGADGREGGDGPNRDITNN